MDGREVIELALVRGVTGFDGAAMEGFSTGEMAVTGVSGGDVTVSVVSMGEMADFDEEGWLGTIRGAEGKRDSLD